MDFFLDITKDINYNNYTLNECISIARTLRNIEVDIQHYIRILEIVYPSKNLLIRRFKLSLQKIKIEQEKIYHLHKNSKHSDIVISLCWYYD